MSISCDSLLFFVVFLHSWTALCSCFLLNWFNNNLNCSQHSRMGLISKKKPPERVCLFITPENIPWMTSSILIIFGKVLHINELCSALQLVRTWSLIHKTLHRCFSKSEHMPECWKWHTQTKMINFEKL